MINKPEMRTKYVKISPFKQVVFLLSKYQILVVALLLRVQSVPKCLKCYVTQGWRNLTSPQMKLQ